MLVGYDRRETWERVLYRFNRMAALGIRPYPALSQFEKMPIGRHRRAAGNPLLPASDV